MRDLMACAGDFPDRPDWIWLRWFWGGSTLLQEGVRLGDLAEREAGRLACLATPYAGFPGGMDAASESASEWLQMLAGAGVQAIAPACVSAWAGLPEADPEPVARLAELVVVPPVPGWEASIEVWRAVELALAAVKPVYLLAEGGNLPGGADVASEPEPDDLAGRWDTRAYV